jgi:phage shock protein A
MVIFSHFTLCSPTGEGQSGSMDEKDNKDDNRVAQLESELKDMQDRLLNVSMQYAEVEAQREELVMELKNATAKKGRWF